MRILFDSKNTQFKQPFGTLIPGQDCRMSVLIPTEISPFELVLILDDESGNELSRFHGFFDGVQGPYSKFTVHFSLNMTGLFFYYFRVKTANEHFALLRYGWDDTNMEDGQKWQISVIPTSFHTPEHLYGGVMYQIFPDRFAKSGDCDTSDKMRPFWIHQNENEIPEWRPNSYGEVENCDFFGGNLAGIAEKLDHLCSLGVSVLYLNPVFKAWSNHRYDTADYMKIDELLGTEEDFRMLCYKAHERGIKIVLDGVFSHVGSRSRYFDEKFEFGNGAVSNPDSPYKSWFSFKHFPHEYTSWWGIKTLPCTNEMDDSFIRYIITDEDSVIAHWLRAGADGFRLDVADELPDEFIALIRKRMKEIKPDSLLIGEVWEDASNKISYEKRRTYFTAGELDSVMNYPWKDAILSFCTEKDGGLALRDSVMTIAENYPQGVLNLLMNMLSTHDTARILSVLSPAPAPHEKSERAVYRMSGDDLKTAIARLKCASFLQFVLPGMPCIFYGDEIGVEGFEDPFCRLYFPWYRVKNSEILPFIQKLGALRKSESALRLGSVSVFSDGCGRVTIRREYDGESLIATVNTGAPYKPEHKGEILFSHNTKENDCFLEKYGLVLVREK